MATRAEITTKYARRYKKASKKNLEVVLDEVIAVTGWTHAPATVIVPGTEAPARTRLAGAERARKSPARKYTYDVVKVLQHVWRSQVAMRQMPDHVDVDRL